MRQQTIIGLVSAFVLSGSVYAAQNSRDTLESEQSLMAKVNRVYVNFSNSHSVCAFQASPTIASFPQQAYLLTNPYSSAPGEVKAFNFKIRNFVLDGHSVNADPYCGLISIKCASHVTAVNSSNFYCERIRNGTSSNPALLSEPVYNKYIAYQTIYNFTVMPRAKKDFGLLKQFSPLTAFPPYTGAPPDPDYVFDAVIYSTFGYPNPTAPPTPNYNNGNYGFLYLGSAQNVKAVCQSIQHDNLSLRDAAVRFNELFGLPPDSPDVIRSFTFFKLRNNPHVSGLQDGNMFRPCPADGSIQTSYCSTSALTIPHDCSVVPPPYNGTTLNTFLPSYFYSSYCNTTPNSNSGAVSHFPWTAQGFTYDWYPWNIRLTNVQGAAEYVAATNSGGDNLEVTSKKTLANFLSTCDIA